MEIEAAGKDDAGMREAFVISVLCLSGCDNVHRQTIDEMVRANKKCLDGGLKSVTLVDSLSNVPMAITCAGPDWK